MDPGTTLDNIIFDHPYQHTSCFWFNPNYNLVRIQHEIIIKSEDEEEIEGEECFIKQEPYVDQESILSVNILDSIENELEDSNFYCAERNWFNDEFLALNIIQEEVTIKSEPSDVINDRISFFMKEEMEDQSEISLIKEEVLFKSQEEELINFNETKDLIKLEHGCDCIKQTGDNNSKEELKVEDHAPQTSEKLLKCTDSQDTGEKPFKSSKGKEKGFLFTPKATKDPVNNSNCFYKCSACSFQSLSKYVLYRHSRIHKETIQYRCNKCDYTSTKRRLLNKHFTTHSKPFKCTICRYRASRQHYLDVHMDTHLNGTYKCYQCEYRAIHKSTLSKHFNTVHLNV